MKNLIIFQGAVGVISVAMSSAATFVPSGAGILLPGSTGSQRSANVGDRALYQNVGTDDNGVSYDMVLEVNGIGPFTTLDLDDDDSPSFPFTVSTDNFNDNQQDAWVDVTFRFFEQGTVTVSNPNGGTPLLMTGVTDVSGRDIDGMTNFAVTTFSLAQISDVIGLYTDKTAATVGSLLENQGFAQNTGQPTVGVDYYRMIPTSTSPISWAGRYDTPTDNALAGATDGDYRVDWDFEGTSVEEFRLVWGATMGETTSINSRGLFFSVNFETVAVVPEPAVSTFCLGLGLLSLWGRRRP